MSTDPITNELKGQAIFFAYLADRILQHIIPLAVVALILQVGSIIFGIFDLRSISTLTLWTSIYVVGVQFVLTVLHYYFTGKASNLISQVQNKEEKS